MKTTTLTRGGGHHLISQGWSGSKRQRKGKLAHPELCFWFSGYWTHIGIYIISPVLRPLDSELIITLVFLVCRWQIMGLLGLHNT